MKKRINGRLPVPRTLPPLAKACAEFKGFHQRETRLDQVTKMLASIVQRHRRSTPQAFYAMREVADFFGVSLKTIATAYRRLGRDGALTLMRSSQTMIPARVSRPRFAVRGVVCMPIWMPGFLLFLDWRKWFSHLEEELARYHFILEPIFYRLNEEGDPSFVDRVLRFNPDYVLWSWPNLGDLVTMNSIADAGVPLIFIPDNQQQFPGRTYRLSYRRGLRRGLTKWMDDGIKEIVMPMQKHEEPACKSLLEAGPLPCRFAFIPPGHNSEADVAAFLRQLVPNQRTGVVFGSDVLYSIMCTRVAEAMIEFMRRHRVLVLRQVTIPLGQAFPSDLTVDALLYPWKRLARQIAMDLGSSKGGIASEQITLEAEWRSQIPLAKVMQSNFDE